MSSISSHIKFAKQLTVLLDLKFKVFGIRFGIDPLLNIIPGFGNILTTATSCYLFWIAFRLNVPLFVYIRMAGNIVLDYIFGYFPYIGIVFDLLFRANVRNVALLENFIDLDILEGEYIDVYSV